MSRGPPPSQLCFLSQVPAQKTGTKVRFLGCITSYDTETAALHLGHLYPRGTNVVVAVDLRLVLETMEAGLTAVGQWVNVIGYVVDGAEEGRSRSLSKPKGGVDGRVQALVVWLTGALDVGAYERAVEEGMALEGES